MTRHSPYQPPESDVDAPQDRGPGKTAAETLLFVLGLAGCLGTAWIAGVLVPHFTGLYTDFSAPVPWVSALVTRFSGVFWALPLLPVALWFGWLGWPRPTRRGRVGAWVAMAIPTLCFPLMIFALYLPIFRMPAAF
jgi:hypothetical protein